MEVVDQVVGMEWLRVGLSAIAILCTYLLWTKFRSKVAGPVLTMLAQDLYEYLSDKKLMEEAVNSDEDLVTPHYRFTPKTIWDRHHGARIEHLLSKRDKKVLLRKVREVREEVRGRTQGQQTVEARERIRQHLSQKKG